MNFAESVVVGLIATPLLISAVLWFLRIIGFYDIVPERTAHAYVLFGNVLGVVREPGLTLLWFAIGPQALLVRLFGTRHVVDMRLDQEYLRSQPVNSEEGAPMGIGIWYEMFVNDPLAFLFKNADPKGSLRANVSNATVRCLSNMPLVNMLVTRHEMSMAVRDEVSAKSNEWGYATGSVYIRKVHFRDGEMIRQIEEKVVNRLRQVTSAIRQDGTNQVNIIRSTAERQAAIEFARAAAQRPYIVGSALAAISQDQQISTAMFELLELQNLLNGGAKITLVPGGKPMLPQLLASVPR